jgi:hypothetical protein
MSIRKLKRLNKPVKSKGDIASRIRPVSEMDDFSSAMLYGESGTGKTALSSTWPKPMLVLDIAEKGTRTIRQVKGVDVIPIETWDDFVETYWYLKTGKGKGKYKTVSLDQVSQLQDLAIAQVRAEKNMKEKEPMSQRLWGEASGRLKTWMYNFRELQSAGMHVIFIAHQRESKSDESDENQIEPSIGARLMPSVASFLNGAVSSIGNTFIRERFVKEGKEKIRKVEYCLRVGPHAIYRSKIRRPPTAGLLPDVIVNPTFEKLEAISRGDSLKAKTTVRKK